MFLEVKPEIFPILFPLLCIFVPAAISQTSILLLPSGGLALVIGYVLFIKDKL